ncbi:unnamed protein product [Owenia fusiformis]|uniref:separase n=1 Tax=Owenia fusiformis TaxID=6347 RepID=A0A8J1XZN0_OWEFU|nr:unnamed protein product [Owenia fusiformis]
MTSSSSAVILENVRNGKFQNIDKEVQAYIEPTMNEHASQKIQKTIGFFCIQFLHSSVGHLNTAKDGFSSLLVAIHIAYSCIKNNNEHIPVKDPVMLHKVLFHIIKNLKEQNLIEEVKRVADYLLHEVDCLDGETKKQVDVICNNSYIILWNSAIQQEEIQKTDTDKDNRDPVLMLQLRTKALKFWMLSHNSNDDTLIEKAKVAVQRFDKTLQEKYPNNQNLPPEVLTAHKEFIDGVCQLTTSLSENYGETDKVSGILGEFFIFNLTLRFVARQPPFKKNIQDKLNGVSSKVDCDVKLNEGCVKLIDFSSKFPTLLSTGDIAHPDIVNDINDYNAYFKTLISGAQTIPHQLNMIVDSYKIFYNHLETHINKKQTVSPGMTDLLDSMLVTFGMLYEKLQNQKLSSDDCNAQVDERRTQQIYSHVVRQIDALELRFQLASLQYTTKDASTLYNLCSTLLEAHCLLIDNNKQRHPTLAKEYCNLASAINQFGRMVHSKDPCPENIKFCLLALQYYKKWVYAEPNEVQTRITKVGLWGRYEAVVDAYRRSGCYGDAVTTFLEGVEADSRQIHEIAESWAKIKRDSSKSEKFSHLISKTLLDVLEEGNIKVAHDSCTVLEQDFNAMKKYCPKRYESQYAVVASLLKICTDKQKKAHVLTELAGLLWSAGGKTKEWGIDRTAIECCEEAVGLLEGLYKKVKSPQPQLCDDLAKSLYWLYLTKSHQMKQEIVDVKPAKQSHASDPINDDALDNPEMSSLSGDFFTISEEHLVMAPLNRALDIWEICITKKGCTKENFRNIQQTIASLKAMADIYKLTNKPTHELRTLCLLKKASLLGKSWQKYADCLASLVLLCCSQGRLQTALTNMELAKTVLEDHPEVQCYQIWLAEAEYYMLTDKIEEGYQVLQNTVKHKETNMPEKTKERYLLDGAIQRLLSRYATLTPHKLNVSPKIGDNALDFAFEAVRSNSAVVNFVVKGISSQQPDMSFTQAENSSSQWHVVCELLASLQHLVHIYITLGLPKEALFFSKEALKYAKAFNIPRRIAEIKLLSARVLYLSDKFTDSNADLNVVKYVLGSQINKSNKKLKNNKNIKQQLKKELDDICSEDEDFIQSKKLNEEEGPWMKNKNLVASPKLLNKTKVLPDYAEHTTKCTCELCSDIGLHHLTLQSLICNVETLFLQDVETKEPLAMAFQFYNIIKTRDQELPKILSIDCSTSNKTDKFEVNSIDYTPELISLHNIAAKISLEELDYDAVHVHTKKGLELLNTVDNPERVEIANNLEAELMYTNALVDLQKVLCETDFENLEEHIESVYLGEKQSIQEQLVADFEKINLDWKQNQNDQCANKIKEGDGKTLGDRNVKSLDVQPCAVSSFKTPARKIPSRSTIRKPRVMELKEELGIDSPIPFETPQASLEIPNSVKSKKRGGRPKSGTTIKKNDVSFLTPTKNPFSTITASMKKPSIKIYHDEDEENNPRLAMKTPVAQNMTPKTPSCASSRKTMLDELLNSDSEDELLKTKKGAKGRGNAVKPKAKSTVRRGRKSTKQEDAENNTIVTQSTTKVQRNSRLLQTINADLTPTSSPVSKLFKPGALTPSKIPIFSTPEKSDNVYDFPYSAEKPKGKKKAVRATKTKKPIKLVETTDIVNRKDDKLKAAIAEFNDVDMHDFIIEDEPAIKRVKAVRAPRMTRSKAGRAEDNREILDGDIHVDLNESLCIPEEEITSPVASHQAQKEQSPNNHSFVEEVTTEQAQFVHIEHMRGDAPDNLQDDNLNPVSPLSLPPDQNLDDSTETLRADDDSDTENTKPRARKKRGPKAKKSTGKKEVERGANLEENGSCETPEKIPRGRNASKKNQKSAADKRKPNSTVINVPGMKELFTKIQGDPPSVLYNRVCHILALASLDQPSQAAYYLTEAMGVSFRHALLNNAGKRLKKLLKDNVGAVDGERKRVDSMWNHVQFNKTMEDHTNMVDTIPQDWSVCQVSVIELPNSTTRQMYATRFRKGAKPLIVHLHGFQTSQGQKLLDAFHEIIAESKSSLGLTDSIQWWSKRRGLDAQLKQLVLDMEKIWFGCWRGILKGQLCDKSTQNTVNDTLNTLVETLTQHGVIVDSNQQSMLEMLLDCETSYSVNQLQAILKHILGSSQSDECVHAVKAAMGAKWETNGKRQPVVLILDRLIQHLPWECMPCLSTTPVTRVPSLHFLSAHLAHQQSLEDNVFQRGVDPTDTFYVLDPEGNLANTKETLQEWFKKEKGWNGVIGKPPTADQFKEGLTQHDMLVYCGHGHGGKFLQADSLQQINCKAATFLMGCSSGKLVASGCFEAQGMVLSYFMAGAPSIVACLWDITDKDIDKFTEEFIKSWIAGKSGAKLLDFINPSRKICKLPHLIGSAPVVYGLPVQLK